jgi:Flp pilus assembly protein TadG
MTSFGKKRRRAGAAVEMAIVTPLLMTMLLGIIEFGYIFTVRQTLVTAAREGARLAALPGSSTQAVQDLVENYLSDTMGLTAKEILIERSTPEDPTESVTVKVAYADVSLVGGYFGAKTYDLVGSCSMRKEGID